jgi:phosphoribosyl-AMP cyclohydrolase / phosphoribosyl-ATP pyrophosphohydrolase
MDLDFSKGDGLVTVVTQDAATGRVLMVACADREAIERTIATGEMHYRSRTRGLWHKGATSGNRQRVVSLTADCDRDAVLARVEPLGPACHTGAVSCFAAASTDVPASTDVLAATDALAALDATIAERSAGGPAESYTRRLLGDRNLRLKKLGEEATELAVACAEHDAGRAVEEAADLFYHSLVALRSLGVGLDDVRAALRLRRKNDERRG